MVKFQASFNLDDPYYHGRNKVVEIRRLLSYVSDSLLDYGLEYVPRDIHDPLNKDRLCGVYEFKNENEH